LAPEREVREAEFQILTEDGVYRERPYKNEQELERLVVDHSEEVFGKSTLYFSVKQRVASKLHSRVTDGLLLDFRNKSIPRLCVVEYELYSHDLEKHTIPQLRGFVKAFNNEETVTAVRETVYNEVSNNNEKLRRFKELAGENSEVHFTLDRALHGDKTLLVVFDRVPENIDDVLEEADFVYDTWITDFRTFEKDGKLLHLVNPLVPLEAGAGEKHVIRSRKAGEKLNQVLDVVMAMKSGQSWNKACHEVASKKGIWHNTVMSATTRGLGLNGKAEFESYLQEGKLAGLLMSRFPEAKARIASVFGQTIKDYVANHASD
jgi:hypothetical protein